MDAPSSENSRDPVIDLQSSPADEIKTTTCYMCACRCGIKVYLKDGQVRYIEGNRDHPVNKGVLCGKGASGIMTQVSPARLTSPLKRVGPRGSGEFTEISWDEALDLASSWLGEVRAKDPRKLALFTGRDQSQALTGWWASQFGTPNFAAHGGFCSVNMAAAGLYTFGGSFWEFGEPDWDKTEYFMLWGVAEDHGSNPIKKALGKLKERGVKVVAVNPVRTGYGAIADEWLGVKPGSDGLFLHSIIYELMNAGKIDLEYLVRYTNVHWLVVRNPGGPNHGLIARNSDGEPLAWDRDTNKAVPANTLEIDPALNGEFILDDKTSVVPVMSLMVDQYIDDKFSPMNVSNEVGLPAETISRIASELAEAAFDKEIVVNTPWTDWAGRKHEKMIGRPVSMHAMRGISAHSNGFNTCRLIHVVQILLGSIDCPGGFLYKPPYPKTIPPGLRPAGKPGQVQPNTPLSGPPLGFVKGPEDLVVDSDGNPMRIDKGFSWDAPVSAHGLMHMVINNAGKMDPYSIDVLFMYMANMGWNSSMNVPDTLSHLTAKNPDTGEYVIPKIIYSDAFYSETIPYADLILPDTTYLERWDCISMLDRPISEPFSANDAIRQPVVDPDRNVRPFQTVMLDLGSRLGLPGMTNEDGSPKYPGGYSDYIINHQRAPGLGPLAGWRGEDGSKFGIGEPNQNQLQKYIENGCFHEEHLPPEMHYYKHSNKAYLEWAKENHFNGSTDQIVFELYSETLQKFRLAAEGHGDIQPKDSHRDRIKKYFEPLPFWYPLLEGEMVNEDDYPFHAITQRPMHMYHSWGSQNAWLRQITNVNRLYMNREKGESLDFHDDDWVWLTSHIGRVKCQIRLMEGCNPDTLWTWNAIGKRGGAWGLDNDAPEMKQGFLLNHLISELLPEREGGYRYSNSDPITGQAAWYDLRVKISKALPHEAGTSEPIFEPFKPRSDEVAPDEIAYGMQFKMGSE